MKIRIFFIIAIVAFAITGAAIFVNASNSPENQISVNKTTSK